MSVILISNTAGKKPTVAQLLRCETGLGYNRVDALFYGIKVTGGVKSVVCLGESIAPGTDHVRLHNMLSAMDHAAADVADYDKLLGFSAETGAVEAVEKSSVGNFTPADDLLYWDSANKKYKPFGAKKSVDPAIPYFYTGSIDPTFSNRLNFDGHFYSPYIVATQAGITAISATGIAVYADSKNMPAVSANVTPTLGNTIVDVIHINRKSLGTASSGIGAGIPFNIKKSGGLTGTAGRLSVKLSDASDTNTKAQFDLQLISNGVLSTKLSIHDTGSYDTLRGQYHYHAQTLGADTVGDCRTYSDANGFYTQHCTLGNAIKGAGTWVTDQAAAIDNEINIELDFLDLTAYVFNCPAAMKFTEQISEGTAATLSIALNTNMTQFQKLTITPTQIGLIILKGVKV